MSIDLETRKSRARAWFESLRDDICTAFESWRREQRLSLVLLTTRAERSYLDHQYRENQVLLFGRESAGVPEEVHRAADAALRIPMRSGLRSLNVAMAAAMVAGEALRQTGGL